MACSAQTQDGPPPPTLHRTGFHDHTGREAIRVRHANGDVPIPEDLSREPVFCLQIYSTKSLAGSDIDVPAAELREVSGGGEGLGSGNLLDLIDYKGRELPMDYESPLFEIYAPQPDALACVEHQRREIAHRKAQAHSNEANVLLIPKVAGNEYDRRRAGFLIQPHGGDEDPDGPLWVTFDCRFPSATYADSTSRLAQDPVVAHEAGIALEDIEVLPEKMEIVVRRMQLAWSMRAELKQLHHLSLWEMRHGNYIDCDAKPDYALDEEEGQPDVQAPKSAMEDLTQSAQALTLDHVAVKEADAMVTISNKEMSAMPSLRYIIYTPFLHLPGFEDSLEQTAKAFTAALTSRLPAETTVHLEFRKPQEPTLSSVLHDHRTAMQSRPADWIGALVTIADQGAASPDGPGTSPTPVRLYPYEVLPINVSFDRYKTFAVILDRPDFISGPGVLFLLTDGGKNLPSSSDPQAIRHHPNLHLKETHRTTSMARTAQTMRRCPNDVWHKKTFKDHAGKVALRVRNCQPDEPIPDNFQERPMYCFQVYSTVPLNIEFKDEQLPEIQAPADMSGLEKLLYYIGHFGLQDAQRPYPAYDIYQPQPDALACVEHQKLEIAHRKACKDDGTAFLIPTHARSWFLDNVQRAGSIVVVTSDRYMTKESAGLDDVVPYGPLWVRFDRCFPSLISAESSLQCDEHEKGAGWEGNTAFDGKFEIEVQRKLNMGNMEHDLKWNYFSSCREDGVPASEWHELERDVDEGQPPIWDESGTSNSPHGAVERLSLSAMKSRTPESRSQATA
ncbi:hypothetical protein LTR85_008105 [Meristemomyces frigidus]|nr:hypothetical protein LTR85_008105 [Meristemomyces frigidus]